MADPKQSRSGLWKATVAAIALFLLAGAIYRSVTNRFERAGDQAPLPAGTLAAVPMQIDVWTGADVALDADVVRATDTDDLLNRRYQRIAGGDRVGFYVAYGGRLRELAPHRPEVCYPEAGWSVESVSGVDLSLADGRSLPCQIHHFNRGGLGSRQIVVLSFYLIDGRFARDISQVRSLAWRFDASAAHMAHMQVVSDVQGSSDRAESTVREFAPLAARQVDDVLTRAIAEQQRQQVPLRAAGASAGSLPASFDVTRSSESGATP
jgi:EpsI family protein